MMFSPPTKAEDTFCEKIIRRAIRHGRLLGSTQPFLAEMARTVADVMGGAYPRFLVRIRGGSKES